MPFGTSGNDKWMLFQGNRRYESALHHTGIRLKNRRSLPFLNSRYIKNKGFIYHIGGSVKHEFERKTGE
jgi:hypothetical protein